MIANLNKSIFDFIYFIYILLKILASCLLEVKIYLLCALGVGITVYFV